MNISPNGIQISPPVAITLIIAGSICYCFTIANDKNLELKCNKLKLAVN